MASQLLQNSTRPEHSYYEEMGTKCQSIPASSNIQWRLENINKRTTKQRKEKIKV